MHPYSTNSPAPPKHIAYMMLAAVAVSAGIGILVRHINAGLGWALGGVSAISVFSLIYLGFDRIAWRWPWARRVLLVPDLNGSWRCEGKTLFTGGSSVEHVWEGTLTIWQSWSRVSVVLKTAQSASRSVAASVYHEPGSGYRLIYHYDNRPAMAENGLQRHCGLCNLLFEDGCDAARGEYFTDQDRMSAGELRIRREESAHAEA